MLDTWWSGSSELTTGAGAAAFATAFVAVRPVIMRLLCGREATRELKERLEESAEARLDRINREQFEDLEKDRDRYRALLQDEERAHLATKRDRDEGWDAGRGMEQWAHDQRHDYANVVMTARGLKLLLEQVCSCQKSTRQACSILAQMEELPQKVPAVPALRSVNRVRPPEDEHE